MANITVDDVNAWLEPTKLTLGVLDNDLESQIVTQIFSRLDVVFDISGWSGTNDTPTLIRSIVAMEYAAWVYDKHYADDADENTYAALLRQRAEQNIQGLLAGYVTLPDVDPNPAVALGSPSFFPNDASSANEPTHDNPSDGGPAFLMGSVF